MCVLHYKFMSMVRPITFGSIVMGSAVLFILRPRLFLYFEGYGVNRVQVVLSGFSARLFCFVQRKLYAGIVVLFLGCTRACE